MADGRSAKLARLVAVQRHLRQVAEASLARTNRERGRVQDALEQTLDAIGSIEPTHQVFAQLYARRIASLSVRADRLGGLAAVQQKRVLSEGAKADRLAEHMQAALAGEAREADDEALYDLLDRIGSAPKPGSSLP